MILVTVGTSTQPFDRLLAAIPALAGEEKVIVQYGASAVRPSGAECVAFLDYDSMLAHMQQARIVVTHAGAGSIIAARMAGKRPLVVPRLRALGEAVDDHQLELARKLDQAGVVRLVADPSSLPLALSDELRVEAQDLSDNPLADDLRAYLLERVGAAESARSRPRWRWGGRG
jgi:UDP-N-acetylglucosamine transferase subunit ALG13